MGTGRFLLKIIKISGQVAVPAAFGFIVIFGSGCNSNTPPAREHLPASVSESTTTSVVATAVEASAQVSNSSHTTVIIENKVPTKEKTAETQVQPKANVATQAPIQVPIVTVTPTPSAPVESTSPSIPSVTPVSETKNMIVPAPVASAAATPSAFVLPPIDFWLWAGVGVNYTSSSQSVEGFSDLEFGRIKSPSLMVRAGFYVSESAGLELGLKNTPGEAKSSETVTVNNGEYNWVTLSAEALYRPQDLSRQSEWTWRLGVQQHQLPFLIPADTNEVTMVDTSMTNLSLGVEYKKQIKKHLRLEWLLRYQYPIASSSSEVSQFHIDPNIGFDGSMGAAYEITEHTYIGIYWYGQYHDFSFKYNTPSAAEITGRQSLFFTNFDLRLGMEF